MTSEIKILAQNLALWDCHFDYFQGQKTRFLEVVWGKNHVKNLKKNRGIWKKQAEKYQTLKKYV